MSQKHNVIGLKMKPCRWKKKKKRQNSSLRGADNIIFQIAE